MELARRMKTAFAANRMPHYMKMLAAPKLLIVDEVGYLGLDHDQASLLFQVICQRYDKQAATIITSNKAFSEWGHVFAGDSVMASAALDRLLHRATVINIKGESYRMKEKRLAGLYPRRGRTDRRPNQRRPPPKDQITPAVFITRGWLNFRRAKVGQLLTGVDRMAAVHWSDLEKGRTGRCIAPSWGDRWTAKWRASPWWRKPLDRAGRAWQNQLKLVEIITSRSSRELNARRLAGGKHCSLAHRARAARPAGRLA